MKNHCKIYSLSSQDIVVTWQINLARLGYHESNFANNLLFELLNRRCTIQIYYLHYFLTNCNRRNPISDLLGYPTTA